MKIHISYGRIVEYLPITIKFWVENTPIQFNFNQGSEVGGG